MSIPIKIKPNFTIVELQNQLERIQEQILNCVAEAKHYVNHVELLNKKVEQLSIEEEKVTLLLEKLKSYRFCQ